MALAPSRPPLSFSRDASTLSLDELIGEARASFAAELAIPMTVNQPPVLTSIDANGERVYDLADADRVGLSMSAQLTRKLGHAEAYGNVFPVARALDDLRGWCRGRHLEARSGPWIDHLRDVAIGPDLQRPLCARLANYTVVWRMQPLWSAHVEDLQLPTVHRLLKAALDHMWNQRREWAHADDSGVGEVLAAQRRERREAHQRAEASTAGAVCRYCGRPYDPTSMDPCPGDPNDLVDPVDAEIYAAAGFTLLCSPATSS